ncbi:MAG TPA: transcription repressor NadR [Halanaerobiales bacterium]|nr:transcription repressor NadR [Halanaerobiales bacterium]
MDAKERREKLINKLIDENEPVTGANLADFFGVTRQVIVQDIALLRAQGYDILATSQGYILKNNMGVKTYSKTIACKHDMGNVKEELMIIVKHGAKIKDVKVEHPIYGEIAGMLMLQTSQDVENFLNNTEKFEASLLSSLTDGVHLHTIEAMNEDVLDEIVKELKEKGFLLEEDL